eukprot:jgi/Tetstr1/429506/TSEL_019411.t1
MKRNTFRATSEQLSKAEPNDHITAYEVRKTYAGKPVKTSKRDAVLDELRTKCTTPWTSTGRGITEADMWLRLAEGASSQLLALPFGDQSQGRAVTQVTVEHSEDREDQPTTPLP